MVCVGLREMKYFFAMAALMLGLLGSGCAAGSAYSRALADFHKQLDAAKGKMSYADAVERWGRPSRIDERGAHFIVVWEEHRHGVPSPLVDFSESPSNSAPVWVFTPRGWRLLLVFDQRSELLESWKYADW